MLDHHIQRSIIHKLSFTPSLSFTRLKPPEIENKLFTYHLKKVISSGYVSKSAQGDYSLTSSGRRLSTGALEKQQALIVERPLSALFLIVRRKSDRTWLIYKRKTHPMLGYKGFMHVRPNAWEKATEAACNELSRKTGLSGSFNALGGGYIRTFKGSELESFVHFSLLVCESAEGELVQNDTQASYVWSVEVDTGGPNIFPATRLLLEKYNLGQPFFLDETFTI